MSTLYAVLILLSTGLPSLSLEHLETASGRRSSIPDSLSKKDASEQRGHKFAVAEIFFGEMFSTAKIIPWI